MKIEGYVFDEGSQLPLSFVNIFVQETSEGTITDDNGNFVLQGFCKQEYHLLVSHIGCETKKLHVHLDQDTILNIGLPHTSKSLGTVIVQESRENFSNQPSLSVNRRDIEDQTNKNLSALLENETGVHLIKNGNGISKPVVHGLYGNRLSILNNGILQAGQQWGNDHSPEIDPLSADKISVLKGANAIEYFGGNLGSIVLVQPKKILPEPHLHGQINYSFESNGRGHNLNARLEKSGALFAWRLNSTLKKYGDRKAPNYFLNNTGAEEANVSLQVERSFKERLFLEFYASTFNTRLGILRGAHISNLTDLENAFDRAEPFFTEPDFNYEISAPEQTVSHHLAKLNARYLFDDKTLSFTFAAQRNNRREFDIRRGGRTELPALSLRQHTLNTEIKYTHFIDNSTKLNIGSQNILIFNRNVPETGILPLIPDYNSWKSGLFGTLSKTINKLDLHLGVRYDYELQKVATISNDLQREIVRFENNFHNVSGVLTLKYSLSKSQSLSFNTGYAMRNPGINELYSNGLHQGVSGIEQGDVNLKTEKAIKNTLDYKWFPNTDFTVNALIYYQYFNDYIYLQPQDEFRLTIRGAFPVFNYEQTNANIYGLDISTQFTLNNYLLGIVKYSYIRGDDRSNDTPLVFIPPNNIFASLTYQANKPLKLGKNARFEETEIELNNKFVFEQTNLLADQDFIPPPTAYNLIGIKISSNLILSYSKLRLFVKADNLLNKSYRDYLNRQRYFADDLGLSITAGLSYKF